MKPHFRGDGADNNFSCLLWQIPFWLHERMIVIDEVPIKLWGSGHHLEILVDSRKGRRRSSLRIHSSRKRGHRTTRACSGMLVLYIRKRLSCILPPTQLLINVSVKSSGIKEYISIWWWVYIAFMWYSRWEIEHISRIENPALVRFEVPKKLRTGMRENTQ